MKWTVGAKFGTLLGAMCLGLVISLGVAWDRLSKTQEVLVASKDRFLQQSYRIGKVELSVIKTSLEARHTMLTDTDAERNETLARIGDLRKETAKYLEEFERNISTEGGRALFRDVKAAEAGFEVAVETNGTQPAPPGLDWICVSPKADAPLALTRGDEMKLVFPQPLARPERFEGLAFRHFLLQPMDGPDAAENTRAALAYCLAHPRWRLSVQTHKGLGIR